MGVSESESSPRRRLAAIMFTDIVGYSALSQENESAALDLLEKHDKLLRAFFPRYHGREVKTIGDSFLVVFDSALDACNCALEIQKFFHQNYVSSKDELKIRLRIGVHLGDVIHRDDDIYGDAVNIASRIQPLAAPEGICVSEQVYDQVHNKLNLHFRRLDKPDLKNIRSSINVYAIDMPLESAMDGEQGSQKLNPRRVAVLPFSSLSPDSQDEYFADGMTEEIISTISKIQGLEVISRTSVMQYKKAPKSIKEISKELEVGTALEGSVRKAGSRLRVTAQMIDTNRDRHIWAESYDRQLEDVFAIQSDIAAKLAEALQAIFPTSTKGAETESNIEAYTTYLRGMQKFHESTESTVREAIRLFEQSASMDKRNSRPYIGLAHAWGILASGGYEDFTIAARKAEIAARRALQLAPDSAEAHAALADACTYVDDYYGSISESKKAIELNPNLSQAYISLGLNRAAVGTAADGLDELRRGYELDPLSFTSAVYLSNVCRSMGRISEALEVLSKLRELRPDSAGVYAMLAECYMEESEFTQAQQMLDRCLEINPDEPRGMLGLALLYAYTGREDESKETLNEISKSETENVRLWGQFYVQTALGNLDDAFEALMRMAEMHAWPFLIKSMPDFQELRKDPRFLDFCKKVNLPP